MELNKGQNLHFSKEVSPWFWSKMSIFYPVFFRSNRSIKILSCRSRLRLSFLHSKNIQFKKWQICSFHEMKKFAFFAEGLVHGFCQKFQIFPCLFLRSIWPIKSLP